jgi:sulfotransferase family protein
MMKPDGEIDTRLWAAVMSRPARSTKFLAPSAPAPERITTSAHSIPGAADESATSAWGPTPVDVAYIGGAGRSGSTVLALLLAQRPEVIAVGGLTNLWERGLQGNYLCGCGAHFRDCEFWTEVGSQAFGGWDSVDADEILRLKQQVTRYRHVPWLLAPRLRPAFFKNLTSYAEYMVHLYRAVAKVSGCRVIVDNSHDVPPALLLRRMPGIRSHIIHLVRDSRGVAFSVSKHVLRSEATTTRTYMDRFSPTESSGYWLVANLLYHVIPRHFLPRVRVHYESLVAAPAPQIVRIAAFLGLQLSAEEVSTLNDESIPVTQNHMISGNPHRLGRTHVEVRLDEEWRTKMKPGDRRLVTLLTLPLALPYGYLGRARSRRRGSKARGG